MRNSAFWWDGKSVAYSQAAERPDAAARNQANALVARQLLALPEAVIAFAWSAPMRVLGAKIGISDVALKKRLNGAGIVTPPQGHWNRIQAGKAVTAPPRPRARRPGERGRIELDARFKGHITEAGPMPEAGPFASKEVPEDLGALRALELVKIGKVAAPRDLARPHPGLTHLLKREEARRAKAAASQWRWDQPHFSHPLAQRQLRLLSGLFVALAKRGHSGEVWEDREELNVRVTIGDTSLGLGLSIVGHHRSEMRRGYYRPARDLPAKTPLKLALSWTLREPVVTAWHDTADRPLEKQLAAIAADLIVAGEATFRQGLAEARERAQEYQRWLAERERERQAAANRERLKHLEASGALLRQAEDLRALISRVGTAVAAGQIALNEGELTEWRAWALARADELDPVLSGQVLQHIRPAGPN